MKIFKINSSNIKNPPYKILKKFYFLALILDFDFFTIEKVLTTIFIFSQTRCPTPSFAKLFGLNFS